MGLDPPDMGVTKATNLATDILKHFMQYLDGTLVGQGLKAIGLSEQAQEDHLRQVLEKAFQLYFTRYPAYNVSSVIDFFRDPVIAQQLSNYLFDHHPIDQQVVESALERHSQQDAISRLVLRQGGGHVERLIPDFLDCYRQVLNEQTDGGERALLLTVLDATDTVVAELRASEARLKALVTEALQAKNGTMPVMPPERVVKAIEAFIDAQKWEESKRIVEAEQDVLLSDMAEQILNNIIEQNSGDERVKQVLQEHRDLLTRCRSVGIERAFQQATPSDSHDWPVRLNNLGSGLKARYERTGNLADLDVAIAAFQQAIQATPSNSPDRSARLNNLGNGLHNRYILTRNPADLEAAIVALEQAVQAAPSNSPIRPALLGNLGNGLRDRYARTRNLADLEAAITASQQAVQALPISSPERPQLFDDLGAGLLARYERTGDPGDLEAAITASQQAVQAAPPDSPDWPDALNNLGSGTLERFNLSGSPADLEQAISLFQQALSYSPPQSSNLPHYLKNLSRALEERYNHTGNRADLEQAIQLTEQSLEFFRMQDDRWEEAYSLRQLGSLARLQGHYSEARHLYEQSSLIARRLGDVRSNALSLYNLGMVAQEQGDYLQARRLIEQSLASFESLGEQSEARALRRQLGILDFLTQPRYVNVSIIRQEDRMIVPQATDLGTRRMYDLRLDISALRDDSIVVNAEQYPGSG